MDGPKDQPKPRIDGRSKREIRREHGGPQHLLPDGRWVREDDLTPEEREALVNKYRAAPSKA
jgi:hypothetical protein